MYFVYQTTHSIHGNGKQPEWLMIDFKEKGVRTGWKLNDKYNNWVWGHDLYQKIKKNPEQFLIVEAEDYEHLKMTNEYKEKDKEFVMSAIDPNSRLGWIAPDGTFIGCSYHDHAFIAKEYLHSSEEHLEATGWCKIYATSENAAENNYFNYYTRGLHFTDAQKEFIKRHDKKFPSSGILEVFDE